MNSLAKVSLRYGVLAGIMGSLLSVALYYLDRHPFLIPVYWDFRIILFVVFIFFTLREIRDYHQHGVLYFWQGVLASLLFTISYAIVASVMIMAFIQVVPEFLSDYIELHTERLKMFTPDVIENIGKEAYDRTLAGLPATDAFDLGFLHFMQSFLISLFISIILSVTLRREPKP